MAQNTQDFSELRRLLATRRQVSPPPGHLSHFSDKVVCRIEADRVLLARSPWRRFVAAVDMHPFWACAYGATVAGALFVGIRFGTGFEDVAPPALAQGGEVKWLTVRRDAPSGGIRVVGAAIDASGGRSQGSDSWPGVQASSINPVFGSRPPNFLMNDGTVRVERAAFQTVR